MDEPEMIERVARAICAAEDLRWEDQADPMRSASGDVNTEHYLHIARAAIEAMREPTDSMAVNGGLELEEQMFAQQGLVFDGAKAVFQKMIDVALAEPTAPR